MSVLSNPLRGYCHACASQPATGRCRTWRLCPYGDGPLTLPSLWVARVDVPTPTTECAIDYPETLTIEDVAETIDEARANALAHGQRRIEETQQRLDECGVVETCGETPREVRPSGGLGCMKCVHKSVSVSEAPCAACCDSGTWESFATPKAAPPPHTHAATDYSGMEGYGECWYCADGMASAEDEPCVSADMKQSACNHWTPKCAS